mmetsp:Transcript_11167/g.29068  ORF Transcript_11167/g.29068 Transcript_11167/m.29068 type:complete len:279 (-) Transcript_11167:35-871(-)
MSSSRLIFRGSRANKMGLSRELDATLKRSHDMRIFGLGFLAECASMDSYRHALAGRLAVYTTMEARFDMAGARSAIGTLWSRFGPELRQRPALMMDLEAVGVRNVDASAIAASHAAVGKYVHAIEAASDDTLVGHFYCRYFADLFGGSMLNAPTRLGLGLPRDCEFYAFPPAVEDNRAEYIESVYEGINEVGEKMDELTRAAVVEEARTAFAHNAAVVTEPGLPAVVLGAGRGAVNIAFGYACHGLAPRVLATVAARMGRAVDAAPPNKVDDPDARRI